MNILILKSLLVGALVTAGIAAGVYAAIAFIIWVNIGLGYWLFGALFIFLTLMIATQYYEYKTTIGRDD